MSTVRSVDETMKAASVPEPTQAHAPSTRPTDSSRILLALVDLAKRSSVARDSIEDFDSHPLAGIIDPGVLRALLAALANRDQRTIRHARRVARLATGVAAALGWDERPLKTLEVASLLHDIGKIGVPDSILFKPGQLTADESELMALHHSIGTDILQACKVDPQVYEFIVQSNQYYSSTSDGCRRLGSEAHQGARILCVADAYDSLRTDQVYREAKPHAEVMKLLNEASGSQFDGSIVAAMERWIDQEGPGTFDPDLDGDSASRSNRVDPGSINTDQLQHIFSHLHILESLYDGFYILDADLKFVLWNLGAERLFGRSQQEVLGLPMSSKFLEYADRLGNELPEAEYPLQQVLAHGRPISAGLRYKKSDGNWRDVEIQSIPLYDNDGQLQGVAEIYRDLSRTSFRPNEYRELKMAASRDPLTKVANRGELETQLALKLTEAAQEDPPSPFSVIFMDIDFFKKVNDNYGHQTGDEVLISAARLLQQECYSGELVARYGGEEFVVLCPETDLDGTVRRAERLRLAIAGATLCNQPEPKVTASFGISTMERGDSVESLCRRADKALYRAKETGRNRVCTLTNADIENERKPNDSKKVKVDPFLVEGAFNAHLGADMIVYKLGGFLNGESAKLGEINQTGAVIQLGKATMFGGWGRQSQKQPVEVVLRFDRPTKKPMHETSPETVVRFQIRPVGRIRDSKVFQGRAKQVIKSLRAYFAAADPVE
ncbi:bifunctional diguanylate cyclase/phosphohydrolase [Calycomorphotria hydatis]|uniref:diguanylate cyclase n=1 Tax=Calycomorphotria hydatis TaxID=2528027 RepID=A0A517T4V1_9PLAN|nr:diguanylate cyclase [Calycomorphotria hydatis]QDT63400.1 putative diguanylate cyclase YdaM [Calycomorphotria hydatis]